ncbi:MAG: DUF456 domain-containing protein [Planctomycetota bacterium]
MATLRLETILAEQDDAGWMGVVQETAMNAGVVGIAGLLVVACALAWLLNLIALPGNWIAVGLMTAYAWLGPSSGRPSLGLATVVIAFAIALLGEILEFAAAAVSVNQVGASRRAAIYAILGSVFGALAGGIVGFPVPILGPLLAALLFGGCGAMAGAIFGEWSDGRPWRQSWRVGKASFWGRTLGTTAKTVAGLLIVLIGLFGVLL